MLRRLIALSVENRLPVVLAIITTIAAGVWALRTLPLEALPDLSDVQVIVQTDYGEQAPRIVEFRAIELPELGESLAREFEALFVICAGLGCELTFQLLLFFTAEIFQAGGEVRVAAHPLVGETFEESIDVLRSVLCQADSRRQQSEYQCRGRGAPE